MKKSQRNRRFIDAFIIALVALTAYAFPSPSSALTSKMGQVNRMQANIQKNLVKDQYVFTAFAQNTAQDTLYNCSYRFTANKKGGGGTSNITQSGKFHAPNQQKAKLSTIEFNKSPGIAVNITLKIEHQGQIIAQDTLFFQSP